MPAELWHFSSSISKPLRFRWCYMTLVRFLYMHLWQQLWSKLTAGTRRIRPVEIKVRAIMLSLAGRSQPEATKKEMNRWYWYGTIPDQIFPISSWLCATQLWGVVSWDKGEWPIVWPSQLCTWTWPLWGTGPPHKLPGGSFPFRFLVPANDLGDMSLMTA